MKSKSSSPRGLYEVRVKNAQRLMAQHGCDLFLIDDPINLFYFTGLQLSAGKLLLSQKEAHLFVDGRYLLVAEENSPFAVSLEKPDSLSHLLMKLKPKNLSFDSRLCSYAQFEKLQEMIKKIQREKGLGMDLKPVLFKEMRALKDAWELQKIRKSAALLWKGFNHLRKKLKVGISEQEAALEFEIFCRKNGAQKLSFEPIIAFGENSAMPHYRAGKRKLKKGDIVLIDIGVVLDFYCSDMTRVLFCGEVSDELKKLFHIVKEAHAAALKVCRPRVAVKQLDEEARKIMRKENVEDLFLHSLGHGVGLEIHEFPRIKHDGQDKDCLLEEGMVITIEPGLYLPGKGGIRYEDTIIITKNGYENLYPASKELFIGKR